jgi:hypothetical protein
MHRDAYVNRRFALAEGRPAVAYVGLCSLSVKPMLMLPQRFPHKDRRRPGLPVVRRAVRVADARGAGPPGAASRMSDDDSVFALR